MELNKSGLALWLAALFLVSFPPAQARELTKVPDEVIVKYRSANRFASHGPIKRHLRRNAEVIGVDDGTFAAAAATPADRLARMQSKLDKLRKDPNVLYAEPNYYGRFDASSVAAPNDPSYNSQWWLQAVGDRAMWFLGRGEGVTVAVIDTGADLTHPDLTDNLLPGANFGDTHTSPQDTLGHGTLVAGIIAAAQNNGVGVSGLAPSAKILPIKINPGSEGTFTSDRLAAAIDYAVESGARIVNLSLTVDQETQTVADSLRQAINAGVVVVAAAGNEGSVVSFPANMAGVIGVAAVDQGNALATFSNRGPEITVAAPGVGIFSTTLGGGYGTNSGTSFSTPVVSAAVADIVSINPNLPPANIVSYLKANATALTGSTETFGILNAGKTGDSLVPHLLISKQQFSASETMGVNFAMPPTGGAVDIYVAVETPVGEFALRPDGTWSAVSQTGYVPLALGFQSTSAFSGTLFGSSGLYPSISLAGLPAGAYNWRTALVDSRAGRILGNIIATPMQLQ